MRKFLFIALVLLVGTNIFLFKRLDSVKKERNRLDSNQAALLSDVEHYKTEAGKNATSVLRLELTKNELEKKNKDLTKTVDDLNIKLKRIQAATTTATKTEIEIETKVRDSIVYRNQLDTLLNFRWRDSFLELCQELLTFLVDVLHGFDGSTHGLHLERFEPPVGHTHRPHGQSVDDADADHSRNGQADQTFDDQKDDRGNDQRYQRHQTPLVLCGQRITL
jgi:hypothetical protein